MMNRYTRPATTGPELLALCEHLRVEDVRECVTVTGKTPAELLPSSIEGAIKADFFIDPDGEVAGIVGISPVIGQPTFGLIWLMGTPMITRYGLHFHRQALFHIKAYHKLRPVLGNIVDSRNEVHIKWLSACGFSILQEEYVIQGVPFHAFIKVP